MRVVLDTNVLLVALPSRSRVHPVFDAFRRGRLTLCLSSEIELEYEELLGRRASPERAALVLNLLRTARNAERVDVAYRWRLITADPGDDKFVDCAVAAGADAIVTEDRHFDVLAAVDFPAVAVWRTDDLLRRLRDA